MGRCPPLLLLALSAVFACAAGQEEDILQCYTCTLTEGDDTCLEDPDNAGVSSVTDCELGAEMCCIIHRIDDNENLGTPLSFSRSCIKSCDPDLIGEMVETPDFSHTTYQTYCNEPKCNSGPGNEPLGQGNGGGEVICCINGIESAATTATLAAMTPVALLLLLAPDPRWL